MMFKKHSTVGVNVTHSFLQQINTIIHPKYIKNISDELFMNTLNFQPLFKNCRFFAKETDVFFQIEMDDFYAETVN